MEMSIKLEFLAWMWMRMGKIFRGITHLCGDESTWLSWTMTKELEKSR